MPLYEYFCSDCRALFDQLRTMGNADDPLTCPDCNGHHTTRTVSNFFTSSGTHNTSTEAVIARNNAGGGSCCGGMCCSGHSTN